MPHKFSNSDKIGALMKWAEKLQERLDTLKDAIQTADTLDRVTGVPDNIRDWGVMNALDESREFSRYAHQWTDPNDTIKVSADRYNEAMEVARQVADWAEVEHVDNRQIFKVPVWATDRIINKLKDAGIRHWVNTV